MKTNLTKYAVLGAFALTFGIATQQASAAPFEMDGGVPFVVDVTAAVDNTADLDVTDVDFGVIGVTSDAADTAQLIMLPDGTITDDIGAGVGGPGEAHIVSETDTGTPGAATFAGLADTMVFVYYSNPVDLTCALCAPGPDLTLEVIQDDLPTPGSFTATGAVSVTGIGTTSPAGALSWNIGATIETQLSGAQYLTGAYAGTFDVLLTY